MKYYENSLDFLDNYVKRGSVRPAMLSQDFMGRLGDQDSPLAKIFGTIKVQRSEQSSVNE